MGSPAAPTARPGRGAALSLCCLLAGAGPGETREDCLSVIPQWGTLFPAVPCSLALDPTPKLLALPFRQEEYLNVEVLSPGGRIIGCPLPSVLCFASFSKFPIICNKFSI